VLLQRFGLLVVLIPHFQCPVDAHRLLDRDQRATDVFTRPILLGSLLNESDAAERKWGASGDLRFGVWGLGFRV